MNKRDIFNSRDVVERTAHNDCDAGHICGATTHKCKDDHCKGECCKVGPRGRQGPQGPPGKFDCNTATPCYPPMLDDTIVTAVSDPYVKNFTDFYSPDTWINTASGNGEIVITKFVLTMKSNTDDVDMGPVMACHVIERDSVLRFCWRFTASNVSGDKGLCYSINAQETQLAIALDDQERTYCGEETISVSNGDMFCFIIKGPVTNKPAEAANALILNFRVDDDTRCKIVGYGLQEILPTCNFAKDTEDITVKFPEGLSCGLNDAMGLIYCDSICRVNPIEDMIKMTLRFQAISGKFVLEPFDPSSNTNICCGSIVVDLNEYIRSTGHSIPFICDPFGTVTMFPGLNKEQLITTAVINGAVSPGEFTITFVIHNFGLRIDQQSMVFTVDVNICFVVRRCCLPD